MVAEFIWTAADFEDLLADHAAVQHDQAFEELVNSQDFDVWSYLNNMTWSAMEADPEWRPE